MKRNLQSLIETGRTFVLAKNIEAVCEACQIAGIEIIAVRSAVRGGWVLRIA